MICKNDIWEKDNITMELLKQLKITLSYPAFVTLMEKGICTEERKLSDYRIAKNIREALDHQDDKELMNKYLTAGIYTPLKEEVQKVYYNYFQEKENRTSQETIDSNFPDHLDM